MDDCVLDGVKGKRLLVLGASASEVSLVERAKEMGVYVIVTDNHLDYGLAPAKRVADLAWDLSWSDIDALEKACRDACVDGVVAGYSEFRVENLIKLCDRLSLPCYCTMEQLDVTRDKVKFKEACRRYGIPTVKEFASPEDVDEFPVIVKPVDRGGSVGVGIASDHEELAAAYDYAMTVSVCKKVIIEKFIDNAVKVDFYYSINEGKITLLSSSETINAKDNGFERVVQSGWFLPSKHHDAFVEKEEPAVLRMIEGLGIRDGYISFSGFVDEDENFVFFETGLRLCGGHLYEYYKRIGMPSNLDTFIFHALLGDSTLALSQVVASRRNQGLKCITVNLYAKAGIIGEISGLEEIEAMESCAFVLKSGRVGQMCHDDKAILDKIGMFYLVGEAGAALASDLTRAYELLTITNEQGEDMLYDRIDPDLLIDLWK